MILLLAGVVIGFFLMSKEKRYTKRNIISFSLHIVLAIVVSFAFADPQFLVTGKTTEVYVLADCSASEKPSIDRIDAAIDNITSQAEKNPGTKVGVIAFGKDCVVLAKPGQRFSSVSSVYDDSDFDYSASDIEGALNFAAEQFSDDAVKRLVLVSDGKQTDGNAIDALETLIQEGITIDTLDLQANFPTEISLTGLKYTDSVYLNREESVEVSINATEPTDAVINLYKNGSLYKSNAIYLGNGVNLTSFDLDTSEAGDNIYKVEVTGQDGSEFNDTFKENNSRTFVQSVTLNFSVLFLGTAQTQLDQFVQMAGLNEEAKIDSYIGTSKVPYSLNDLILYDEIVLADVDVSKLDHYSEFVDNLTTAVSVYGKSVFTFDSTHAGNTNDNVLNKYNDLLPVQYQPDDTRAVVLLIDTSGSMGGNNIDMAIQGAQSVVDKLDNNDSIAVVTFDDEIKVPVAMTTIRNDENRFDIKSKIGDITANGGTSFLAGMKEAYAQIEGVTAEYKNIITLSDGKPSENPETLKDYVTSISFSNISCSFINIGDLDGVEILETLAKLGNGKYYFLDSAFDLKDVMVDSIDQEVVNSVIEKESDIVYWLKDDPSLNGGVYNNLPSIGGYNYCRIKSGSNTVLTVQYIHTDSDNELSVIAIPLYAYWTFGRGKVSSFTSSLDTEWTRNLRNSEAGKTFFRNIISQSLPESFNRSVLDVEVTANGSTSDVTVTPNIASDNTKISLEVSNEQSGTSEDYSLIYDGSSFIGEISTPEVGIYKMTITYSKLDADTGDYQVSETRDYFFSFDYSSEFNFFDDTENILLYQLADQGGGTQLLEDDIVFEMNDDQLSQATYKSAMVWFLVAAVIIYLADITVRKTTFRKKVAKKPEDDNTKVNYF